MMFMNGDAVIKEIVRLGLRISGTSSKSRTQTSSRTQTITLLRLWELGLDRRLLATSPIFRFVKVAKLSADCGGISSAKDRHGTDHVGTAHSLVSISPPRLEHKRSGRGPGSFTFGSITPLKGRPCQDWSVVSQLAWQNMRQAMTHQPARYTVGRTFQLAVSPYRSDEG